MDSYLIICERSKYLREADVFILHFLFLHLFVVLLEMVFLKTYNAPIILSCLTAFFFNGHCVSHFFSSSSFSFLSFCYFSYLSTFLFFLFFLHRLFLRFPRFFFCLISSSFSFFFLNIL